MGSQTENVIVKLSKISSYLSSFEVESSKLPANKLSQSSTTNSDLVSVSGNKLSSSAAGIKIYYGSVNEETNIKNFNGRLHTYGIASWNIDTEDLSVYQCVRWGWFLKESGILCCCGCRAVLSLQLPSDSSSVSYKHAVKLLKERLQSKHEKNCRWLNSPDPVSLCYPPSILSPSHIYNLVEASHGLMKDIPKLPYIDLSAINVLNINDEMLHEVWGEECDIMRQTALFLLLCGWKKGRSPNTLRCELCKRNVGIWHFMSLEEKQSEETSQLEDLSTEESETVPTSVSDDKSSTVNNSAVTESNDTESPPEQNSNVEKEDAAETQSNKRKRSEDLEVENNGECKPGESSQPSKKLKHNSDAAEPSNIVESNNTSNAESNQTIAKPTFHPLNQHRYWCSWINEKRVTVPGSDTEESEQKGYKAFCEQLVATLKLTRSKQWTSTEKYSSSVEGLRNVRSLLSSWTK